ncbi:hypothetical protein IL306_009610, partial [Fusarium sp. DS 682]
MSDLGSRLGHPMRSSEETAVDLLGDATGDPNLDLDDLSSFFEKTASGLVQDALAGLTEDTTTAAANPNPQPEQTPTITETTEPPPVPESTKSPEKEPTLTPQTNSKVECTQQDYKELEALVAQ